VEKSVLRPGSGINQHPLHGGGGGGGGSGSGVMKKKMMMMMTMIQVMKVRLPY
jgi:hypothetical protein